MLSQLYIQNVAVIEKVTVELGLGLNAFTGETGAGKSILINAINAITGGTDALGEVTVRLKENGHSAVGRGTHPDIFVASAKAYVDALNHLAKREEEGRRLHCQYDDKQAL